MMARRKLSSSGSGIWIAAISSTHWSISAGWRRNIPRKTPGTSSQQWSFVSVGSGYYNVINRNSGKCLDVNGVSTADGANSWRAKGYPGKLPRRGLSLGRSARQSISTPRTH